MYTYYRKLIKRVTLSSRSVSGKVNGSLRYNYSIEFNTVQCQKIQGTAGQTEEGGLISLKCN